MPFCLKIFELNTNKNIQKYLKILHKIKFQCCIIFVKLFYENIMNNPKVEYIQYLFGWDCTVQYNTVFKLHDGRSKMLLLLLLPIF